jgi:chemotaxis protein methyltransferase CheR
MISGNPTPAPPPSASMYLRKMIQESSAIVLDANKDYLLQARLWPLVQREGMGSWEELVTRLAGPAGLPLRQRVVEAVTTHETSFFRDIHPFDAFRAHVLPRLEARRPGGLAHVWSAAASTGQEVYTLAMLAAQQPGLRTHVRFLATDLSTEILARAQAGRFSQLEINRGLPASYLVRYFQRDGVDWRVKDEIRSLVDFRIVNLIGAWPALPEMDVVFLRNVLIYFDVPTKKQILARVAALMRPGALLFLGSVESTLNLCDRFTEVRLGKATCYERTGQ